MMAPQEQFRDAIASSGLTPPEVVEADGKLRRFPANGKRGDVSGWYVLHHDGVPAGAFGDWRSGVSETWRANLGRILTPAEEAAHRTKVEAMRKQREAEEARRAADSASEAARIWRESAPAGAHPYLQGKDIKSHGAKLNGGRLVLPMRVDGELCSLQFIAADGEKRFLPGGKVSGAYFSIGKPEGGPVLICEGYATGASLHEATGHAVAVAFNAGNLVPVAKVLRGKFQDARLILCADDDARTEGNPGLSKAKDAAQAVGGMIAVPDFGADRNHELTDFNDLAQAKGAGAVKRCIEAAQSVESVLSVLSVAIWPSPERLPELPEVPPFNFNVLPGTLRGLVHDVAERMQCPPEFPAVGVVVMAGAAIGCRMGIRPKKFDPWTVVPNLWGAIIGKSGIMKSPALKDAIAPLKRMQAKAFEDFEDAKTDYEIAERAAKIKAADADKKAREAYAKDRGANLSAYLKPDAELEEPKPRRYIVNDATPEALCETLKDNPNGVLCERDELIGLLRSMDKEGAQEARALYLTAADGDKSFTVDRIMRGSGRHIERVCVSIVGGIQPGVLAGYVRETQRGGAGDDGLLQRFGLMVYPDLGKYRHVDRPEDREARDAVHSLIERLCNLKPEDVGAELDPYGGIPFLRFSSEAQALFIEWLDDLEGRIRSGEDHPAITSHLSKYRKNVPALALINHLCEGGTGPVSEAALGRALLFIELLEAHARRVYSYAARPDLDAAKTILAKLKSGKLPIEFTARHVYRAGWSGLQTPEEAGAALRALLDYGYLQERIADTGGRSSTIYRAHPSCKAAS